MNKQKFKDYFEGVQMVIERQHINREKKISSYFADLNFRLDNYHQSKKLMDVYLSHDFNVFDLISPDENKLSDIISNLLDVSGTHGQGDLFLREFFSVANISASNFSSCKIFREDATTYITHSNRRIDITIDLDDFGIGIENKPWALEQTDQIKDYHEHLYKKYNGNFSLVYMTGDGSPPTSIDDKLKRNLIDQGKLIMFPYPTLFIKWLKLCKRQCESEKYRWFLRDFIEYIITNFSFAEI